MTEDFVAMYRDVQTSNTYVPSRLTSPLQCQGLSSDRKLD